MVMDIIEAKNYIIKISEENNIGEKSKQFRCEIGASATELLGVSYSSCSTVMPAVSYLTN